MSEKYVHEPKDEKSILEVNDGTKRTLSALYKQLEQLGIDTDLIKASIKYLS